MFEKMSIKEVEEKFKTSIKNGLSVEEAERRLKLNGKNSLIQQKKESLLKMFLCQLNDPVIYILIVAVMISLFLKEVADVFVILTVVIVNGLIGVAQEAKAEKALDALKEMTHPVCSVKRNGALMRIQTENLVVGDLVELEAGQKIPADIRLVESKNMKVVESSLTGESLPSLKNSETIFGKIVPLGDKENMAFMSTTLVNGRGTGIVVATGMKTEIGKIAGMLKKEETELTPLQRRLASIGKILGVGTIVLCVLLLMIGLIQKRNLYTMLLTSISLAVAAIPEGLPAVVTIVLSLGVQRMAKLNTIVRKLSSVETLGAVNVVCSDKTGTLTQNKMIVEKVYMDNGLFNSYDVGKFDFLAKGMLLCNDASVVKEEFVGDPTEIALIQLGALCGYNKGELEKEFPRINEIPFDSNRKMMSTIHSSKEGGVMYTKGAVEEVLKKCNRIMVRGNEVPLTNESRKRLMEISREMSHGALRVLGLAYKNTKQLSEDELIFVGMVGMKDPVREDAKKAVETFGKAGIKTVMITGDHIETAFAVAEELGIASDINQCVNGEELDGEDGGKIFAEIDKYRVFARVSPENKVSIVKAFKEKGLVVAMTGDGVNDAPSLKRADVGIAMGNSGTDVAKEAADMVLNDDNFASIELAVEEGRVIYSNIKKSVLFLLSSNFAEIVAMLFAVVVKAPVPLLAIHILWVNLITDSIPALALGSDLKEEGVMELPPRKVSESLFAGGVKLVILYGVLIGAICMVSFFCVPVSVMLDLAGDVTFSGVVDLLENDADVLSKAQTFSLITLSVCELCHALVMRNVDKSFVRVDLFKNKLMIFSLVLGFALQWIVVEIPFMNGIFKTSNITFGEWCFAVGGALLVLVIHELEILLKQCKKKIRFHVKRG